MATGYIKLFRCLKQSAFYKDSEYVHLWIHLLMSVNRTEKRLKLDHSNQFVDLHPGQVLTSRDKLSEQTGIHRSKVDRILKSFKSEQQIEHQTFSKYRIISILNWKQYQCSEQQSEPQVSSKRAASEPQMSTNKNEKKEGEGKEEKLRRLSPGQVKDEYLTYAGVLQVNSGQLAIFSDLSSKYPSDIIIEAFQAGAAGNKRGAGYLSWCMARMKGKVEEETAKPVESDDGDKQLDYIRSLGYDIP